MLKPDALQIDALREAERIEETLRDVLRRRLRRKGFVLGVSGGVDSSVCLALCARALGPERVFALLMPERDSDPASLELGTELVEQLGVPYAIEDIAPGLEGMGCYARRDEAIRSVFPEYGPGWRQKIVLPQNLLEQARLNVFHLVVEDPQGQRSQARLPLAEYLQIVAATNMKQRMRKAFEYYHADRLGYAVVGTPNRLEYDQGFFVKNGDGSADVKPIAHLYKTQVYQLARALGLPQRICEAQPTTDTYSLAQTQEEFYFCLPYDRMDLLLFAHDTGLAAADAAPAVGLSAQQVERVYADIESKRRTTLYQHLPPLLVDTVPAVHDGVRRVQALTTPQD